MPSKARFKIDPGIRRYGIALAGVALATALRLLLDSALGTHLPFTTYFIAAMLVAIYSGLGPALVSVALGGALGSYLFIPPNTFESSGVLQLTAYCILSAGLSILIKVIQDARNRAERTARALAESKERLATILASIADAVIATDVEGCVTFMNGVAQSLIGCTQEEASGRPIQTLFTMVDENTREPAESPVERVLRGGVEHRSAAHALLIAGDGRLIPIEDNSSAIKSETGKTTGVVLVFRDITDRRKVEEAFYFLASIVESSEDAILGKTLDGTIVSWNAAAERIYGYTAEEVKGKHISILAPPDRLGELDHIFDKLRRGESISHLETVRRTKDGRLIDVALTISPIRDEAEQITRASTIARDITDRKRVEEEKSALAAQIERARQRLNNVVANVPGVVWEACGLPDQASQRIDFVSEHVEKMLGYGVEEWLSTPNFWLTIVHPADRERAAEEAAAIYETRKGGSSRFRWIARDGRVVWVEAQSVVICDDSENPIGMRGVTMDITERQRAEESQRFLAEASGLLASSLDYEITLASVAKLAVPKLADWCAVHVPTETGELRQLAIAHTDPARLEAARDLQSRFPLDPNSPIGVANVLRTGRPEFYSHINKERLGLAVGNPELAAILRKQDLKSCMIVPLVARNRTLGTVMLITAESDRYYDQTDLALAEDLAHRIALAVDNAGLYREAQGAVTAREEALLVRDEILRREQAAREEAEAANRAKDEFLATVSHELRTPLNAILGWAHMLRANKLDPTTRSRALETIERNAKSQAQLVEDILDVSRIVTGKLRLDVGPVELAGVVESAIDAVRPAASAKEIRIELILDPRAGPVSGDPNRLQQVVWNLAANAVKFTSKGGVVQVRLERVGSHVEIVVSDTGQGISPEFLPFVFERFRQADATSTRRHGGLGLGLAIARHLTEMHGGTIQAESSGVGMGATFIVRLPLIAARIDRPDQERVHSAASGPLAIEPLRLEGVSVLVVDDERDTREMLKIMIGQLGAQVRACASSKDALNLLGEWRPDVIVSDIEMPDEDGYELIRKVRRSETDRGVSRVPAVALTAYGRVEDRLRALAAGYQTHIAKPAEPAELAMVISSLAGSLSKDSTL